MRRFIFALGVVLVLGGVGCGGVDHTALWGLEDCVNGVDDNGDGQIDCEDPQCVGHAACLGMRELACANGADDDGDGQIDCEDPDCLQTSDCDPSREWSCHDGVDNDHDGLTDCADPDCQQACTEKCDDGADNDGDDLIDCADPDCVGHLACTKVEICNNEIDDDGDQMVDCADPDCAGHPACTLVEICNNEIDDDGDQMVDCADPDCAQSPYCTEVNCLDGVDNDGDGSIDCDDPDCTGALACQGGTDCLPALPLACGQTVVSTTEGALNNFVSYPCHTGTFSGPERYFQFTAPRDLYLDIYLLDWDDSGLTMIATSGGPGSGCDIGNVCESEVDPGYNYLPFFIEESATLFLIVDSPTANMPGAFDLWMDCTAADEVGLCGDGLDNDGDGLYDCWDSDCEGDPGCNYWVSAGIYCDNEYDCAPGEYCEDVTFQGTTTVVSFCTRSCSSGGMLGGECATAGYGDGLCTSVHSSNGPRCVLPCDQPADPCPPGSVCTDIISGSILDLINGFCLPYQ